MPVKIITVEREYGSGSANIARTLAERLGWKLWDQELSAEIARVANVDTLAARRCDERVDPLLYRLFKVYARGSYERALTTGESRVFDTDCMVDMLHQIIEDVASRGNCVIVGRGSPYILRKHPDAYHVFVYAPVDEKVSRIQTLGKTQNEALELVHEVDRERAEFIHHYFGKEWPCRPLYNLMINSKFGDDFVIDSILQNIELLQQRQTQRSVSA
jgi:cytidylate kinase